MYYVYMLRCSDNSIYTGITTDLERRINEHVTKNEKCAKYTLRHSVVKLEIAWVTKDRKLASKLEYNLKRVSKKQKEELISNEKGLYDIFKEKIDASSYCRV